MIVLYGGDYADINAIHCWAIYSSNANASMNDKHAVRDFAQHA
jgi:hypothetical protein